MLKGSGGHHLSSKLGLGMHHFSKADFMLSALTIGMVVTGTSNVRKDAMISLSSVLQKGFTLMQNREHTAQAPVKVPLFPLNLHNFPILFFPSIFPFAS